MELFLDNKCIFKSGCSTIDNRKDKKNSFVCSIFLYVTNIINVLRASKYTMALNTQKAVNTLNYGVD